MWSYQLMFSRCERMRVRYDQILEASRRGFVWLRQDGFGKKFACLPHNQAKGRKDGVEGRVWGV